MTTLRRLFDEQGQSPWLDNLKRAYFSAGMLQSLVDQGIRGVTSNPTISRRPSRLRLTTTSSSPRPFAGSASRTPTGSW